MTLMLLGSQGELTTKPTRKYPMFMSDNKRGSFLSKTIISIHLIPIRFTANVHPRLESETEAFLFFSFMISAPRVLNTIGLFYFRLEWICFPAVNGFRQTASSSFHECSIAIEDTPASEQLFSRVELDNFQRHSDTYHLSSENCRRRNSYEINIMNRTMKEQNK